MKNRTRGAVASLLLASSVNVFAQQSPNNYVFNRDYNNYKESYFVSLINTDDKWVVTSINKRKSVVDKNEEILLAKKHNGGWQFNPYFKYINLAKQNAIWCEEEKPHGMPDDTRLNREENTNICNSKFVTSTPSADAAIGKALGYGLATIYTAGLGAVVLATMKESERYIDLDEIKKAVSDTKLDELLSELEPIRASHFQKLFDIRARHASIAKNIKTDFVVTDLSGGFGKNLNQEAASKLITYEQIKVLDHLKFPVDFDGIEDFKTSSNSTLDDLAAKKISVAPKCRTGNSTIGVFNISIPSCPTEVILEDDQRSVSIPLTVISITTNVTPSLFAADKALAATLKPKGLSIENRTDEFIDITDVSVSINGKIKTISGEGKPLITVPPKSIYPRDNENSKLSANELIDSEMKSELRFSDLTAQSAKQKTIPTGLSLRYTHQNTGKTLRSHKNTRILDIIEF